MSTLKKKVVHLFGFNEDVDLSLRTGHLVAQLIRDKIQDIYEVDEIITYCAGGSVLVWVEQAEEYLKLAKKARGEKGDDNLFNAVLIGDEDLPSEIADAYFQTTVESENFMELIEATITGL